jgi:hypothetical protein
MLFGKKSGFLHSKKPKFLHKRQKNPKLFEKGTFETVPLNHAGYSGEKYKKWNERDSGAKAIVGKLKKSNKWSIQSILIPKSKKALVNVRRKGIK